MTPETNHDVEISIYYDFLEDQGIYVDRTPEEQDQWIYEYKYYNNFGIGGGVVGLGGGSGLGGDSGIVGGGGSVIVGVGISVVGGGVVGNDRSISRRVGG